MARFDAEDLIRGNMAVPYTMNHYGYCWNNPMNFVDRNGAWPTLSELKAMAQKKAQEFVVDLYVTSVVVNKVVEDIKADIVEGATKKLIEINNGYQEFKAWGADFLEGAGNAIVNGANTVGNIIQNGVNGAINGVKNFVSNKIVGVDTVYYENKIDSGTTYKVTSHSGGNIIVISEEATGEFKSWAINESLTVGDWTLKVSLTGKSLDPSTWVLNNTVTKALDGGIKVTTGNYLDKDGWGYQLGQSGTSGNMPLELPNGVIIDDYASLNWSINSKVQTMNWTQCFECVCVVAAALASAYIVVNDLSGVGVADDGLLVPLGGYIASRAPWLYDMLTRLIPALQPCMN